MQTKEYKVYKFNELTKEQQQKALLHCWDINVDYEWWESNYDDALNIGLKITSFDIDRSNDCTGNFTDSAEETAHKIETDLGEECTTYQTAKEYLSIRDNIVESAEKDEDGELVDEYKLDSELDDADSEFLKSLLEDYFIILRKEYEYKTSEEAIIETIEANEYEFTEEGKID